MIAAPMTTEIDYDQLATLKEVALIGSFDQETEVASKQLSDRFDVSKQTITRRLQVLDQADLITRNRSQNGQRIRITPKGRRTLVSEWDEYCQLFRNGDTIELRGKVSDGLGKAQHFISLSGYVEQFKRQLGYEPYPGTLNVSLDTVSTARRSLLADTAGIVIEQWEDGDETYGAATCYPALVETESGLTHDPVHVLVPDRTDHDSDELEVIAATKLRDRLELEDNEVISVYVRR